MTNLEQLRAKNALKAARTIGQGSEGGDAVEKKVPAQIIANGFIGALAFAIERGAGYADVFRAVIDHLNDVKAMQGMVKTDLPGFLAELCDKSSAQLRAITEESMAYLGYLRRFVKSSKTKDEKPCKQQL